jgi:acetylornithine/N-succinyldiaminopimelate aminotransferase
MLGIEFNCEVKELIEICRQQGLLLLGAGPRVLRLVPPLTVSKDEIDLATITLQRALEKWN